MAPQEREHALESAEREVPLRESWKRLRENLSNEVKVFVAESAKTTGNILTRYGKKLLGAEEQALKAIDARAEQLALDFEHALPDVKRTETDLSKYRETSDAELNALYKKLFDQERERVKRNPERLKAYQEALKKGVAPRDEAIGESELNDVWKEIQDRKQRPKHVVAPIETPLEQASVPTSDDENPDVVSTEDAGAKVVEEEDGIPILSADEAGAVVEETPVRADLGDVVPEPIEEWHDQKAEVTAPGPDDLASEFDRLLAETPSVPKAEAVAVEPEAQSNHPPAPSLRILSGHASPEEGEPERPENPHRKVVLARLDKYFEKASDRMKAAVAKDLQERRMEESEAYVAEIRRFREELKTDRGLQQELEKRVRLADADVTALTDEDLEDIRMRLAPLYDEAVSFGGQVLDIKRKKAVSAQKTPEPPATTSPETSAPTTPSTSGPMAAEKPQRPVTEARESSAIPDVNEIVQAYLNKHKNEPTQKLAKLLGKMGVNAFLKDLTDLRVINAEDGKALRVRSPEIISLRDNVSAEIAKR